MSLEEEIRQLVLAISGVATVYAADPIWVTAVKQLGALLGPGDDAGPVPFVVCTEGAEDPLALGADDGGFPAAAAGAAGAGVAARTVMTVRVRIGTDGLQPAPATARAVAAAIRDLVSARRREVDVKAVVEVSAIGV